MQPQAKGGDDPEDSIEIGGHFLGSPGMLDDIVRGSISFRYVLTPSGLVIAKRIKPHVRDEPCCTFARAREELPRHDNEARLLTGLGSDPQGASLAREGPTTESLRQRQYSSLWRLAWRLCPS